MFLMTSQILKIENFTKTKKSRYLENKTLFFLLIRKLINYTLRIKNNFVGEVIFKL